MSEKIPARFRKTKTDRWAVMAPVEDLEKALAEGGKIEVQRKSGDWGTFIVGSLGRPFEVDGVQMCYGYAPGDEEPGSPDPGAGDTGSGASAPASGPAPAPSGARAPAAGRSADGRPSSGRSAAGRPSAAGTGAGRPSAGRPSRPSSEPPPRDEHEPLPVYQGESGDEWGGER